MTIKKMFQAIKNDKGVTQLEMANVLGISKQNFSNKVQRNTFSPEELAKIAELLDMELAFIDKCANVTDGIKYVLTESEEAE